MRVDTRPSRLDGQGATVYARTIAGIPRDLATGGLDIVTLAMTGPQDLRRRFQPDDEARLLIGQ